MGVDPSPVGNDPNEVLKMYQDLVETSQDLIWQCDTDERYTYLNPAWESLFGYHVEEMLGKRFTDFQDPASVASDVEVFGRLLEDGIVRGYETVHRSKSGKQIHLSFNAKYVRDHNGRVTGTRGTAQDITERKLVERALRESEKKFALIFQCVPVLISITDAVTGEYLDVNDEAVRITGFSREEIVGFTAVGIGWITMEQRARLVDEVKRCGSIAGAEMTFKRKNGSSMIGVVNGAIVVIGGRDCLLTATLDITARKLTEVALRESEARFRTLFMSISEGFYLSEILRDDTGLPFDYRFLEVNPTFEKILGMSHDRIIGKRYSELVPVDTTGWIENYCKVAASGKSSTFEFFSPDYSKHFETFAYTTAEQRIAVFVRDVTERKHTESTLQNVQKLESLGVLAGGIAHDFNNLLGGIFGFIDLALIETGNEKATRYLSKAMGAIDRARGLTHQLLTFAKGGAPVMKTDDLFPFVYDTARFALSGSRVACTCCAPEEIWPSEFDRNQIGQVIDNIVINAQQAMPDGGSIAIGAMNVTIGEGDHVSLAPGNYVKISIEDHGIGMPKEILHRIFDPFYTTKPKGHGLGLATCYSIVKRHEGCIDVESEPGKGSVFHVFLKACPDAATHSGVNGRVQHRGVGAVLIMDDEEVIRDSLSALLESFGYSVVVAKNGSEAISILAAEKRAGRKFALMIFDLTVPGDSGGREIVGDAAALYPQAPVFVASGYAADPVMARPREFGFAASICKPFRREDLGEMLEKYLNAGRAIGNFGE